MFGGVNAQMCLKVRGAVECLGADDADKWPNGGVRETMTRQISRLTESPSALVTGERLFPRVNSLSTNISTHVSSSSIPHHLQGTTGSRGLYRNRRRTANAAVTVLLLLEIRDSHFPIGMAGIGWCSMGSGMGNVAREMQGTGIDSRRKIPAHLCSLRLNVSTAGRVRTSLHTLCIFSALSLHSMNCGCDLTKWPTDQATCAVNC